jgi:hypothetical protein
MKPFFILLFTISYTSFAQSTVETSTTQERKATMTTKQRIQLNAFESLSVIDTDENRSYVFRSGQWVAEFSDAEIMAARNKQQTIKSTNASWKEFDEMSRPLDANTTKSTLSTPATNQVKSTVFQYLAIDGKSFAENKFSIQVPEGKQISFIKVYFKNTPESTDLTLEGTQARKILSDKLISFKYFENKASAITFRQSIAGNEILGVLLAYTD